MKNKKIFSHNVDIKKNAYMNWRTEKTNQIHNLHVLAGAYANGAKVLINQVMEDNTDKKADILIFPILYNIDQSIELYEKCILLQVHTLSGSTYTVPNSHDINQLCSEMISAIRKRDKIQGVQKNFNDLSEYISELFNYIKVDKGRPNMDFARYPIKTDGSPHFYITEKNNMVINVEALQERFISIVNVFEGIVLKYFNEIETREASNGNIQM